jgi:hypothetical protein
MNQPEPHRDVAVRPRVSPKRSRLFVRPLQLSAGFGPFFCTRKILSIKYLTNTLSYDSIVWSTRAVGWSYLRQRFLPQRRGLQ